MNILSNEVVVTPNIEKRNILLDNIKGFLIILVVLGHLIAGKSSDAIDVYRISHYLIYAVHMPMFILISGIFSKNRYDINKFLKNCIIPYVTFDLLFMLFDSLGDKFDLNIFVTKNGYWYILCLGIMRLLVEYTKQKYQYLLLIGSIIGSVALIFAANDIWRFLSIGRVLLLFPVFMVGLKFRIEWIGWIRKHWYIFIILAFIIVALEILLFIGGGVTTGTHNQPQSITDLIFKYIYMMLFTTGLFATFIAVFPDKHIPIITKCGRNSVMIYLIHFFVVKIIVYVIKISNLQWNNELFGILVVISIILSWILSSDWLNSKYNAYINKISSFFHHVRHNRKS